MAVNTKPSTALSAAANDSSIAPDAAQYLMKRSGIYTFKRRIPAAAAQAFGRKSEQYWKSLRTRELGVALSRLEGENRWFEQQLEAANDRFVAGPPSHALEPLSKAACEPRTRRCVELLEAHLPHLLARYEYRQLREDELARQGMSVEQLDSRRVALQGELQRLRLLAARGDLDAIDGQLASELVVEGLIATKGSAVWRQLQKGFLARARVVTERLIRRAAGEDNDESLSEPVAPRDLPTLQTLHDAWAPSQEQVRTLQTFQYYVDDFESVIGTLPVAALSTAHVETYRDALMAKGLCRATVKNRVGGLATLARFSRMDDVAKVLDDARLVTVPEREVSERPRPFEKSELDRLFNSKLYRDDYRPEGQATEAAYVAPVVALFAGPRLEEVAQLRVDDVECIDGNWAFRFVNLCPDQHLKTPASFRRVPIHQVLLDCGILEYVEYVRRAGHDRLFPSLLNDNKYRRWGNALGRWFSRYLVDIGMADGRLCFKSFRYVFKQQCVNVGVDSLTASALTGHWLDKKKEPGNVYLATPMVQYPFPALVEAMKKLRYSELDLSHVSFRPQQSK